MTYEFKIKISGLSKPSVWRRVIVPGNYTFFQFHKVIQIAFGWENLHFFEFYDDEDNTTIKIFMPYEEDVIQKEARTADATKTKLCDIFSDKTEHFLYFYDSNDHWIHEITIEKTTDDVIPYPKCIAGEGMCPPEGCGGTRGYEYMKNVIENKPESEDATRFREWMFLEDDDIFDPTFFPESEINEINEYLKLFKK